MKKESGKAAKRIIIIDEQKHELPYSKGLTASAIMSSGLPPQEAYDISSEIEGSLLTDERFAISAEELHQLIYETLKKDMGERYAENYLKYHTLSKLNKPLVILIGGATGVGKSTIATMLATRLGIVRIVSTDAIREVMRAFFSEELMPAIHRSSFDVGEALRQPLPPSVDPVTAGFREQTVSVTVGVKALVDRAVTEGTHLIIEGAHIVPGFIDPVLYKKNAFLVPLVITVKDEGLHRSHFYIRELDTQGSRPFERYVANFESIRRIQDYIIGLAESRGIKTVDSINLDATMVEVIEFIINTVYEMDRSAANV